MAKDLDIKEKFIDLRSKGISYDKVAKELQVNKSTLIEWGKHHSTTILNLKNIRLETLDKKYLISREESLKTTKQFYRKMRKILLSRDLNDIPTEKLIKLYLNISEKLEDPETIVFYGPYKPFKYRT